MLKKALIISSVVFLIALLSTSCLENQQNAEQNAAGLTETVSSNLDIEEEQMWQQAEEPEGELDSLGENKTIRLQISYVITLTGDTRKIEFISTLPSDYEYRQEILDYSFSIEPSEIYSADENTYARFIINEPLKVFSIDMNTEMRIYDFDLNVALENQESVTTKKTGLDNPDRYLGPEPNIEVDDKKIKEIASTFSASSQLSLVEEIYNFVLESMTYYGYNPENIGAAEAVLAGGGDCTEYSDLFVALCRASGIPARVIEGYVIDAGPDELSLGHNWSEVHIEELGWIPFDAIYDDNNGESRETTFNNLKNIYVYTSFERNDPELFDFHYYAYVYYGDNIEVTKDVSVVDI